MIATKVAKGGLFRSVAFLQRKMYTTTAAASLARPVFRLRDNVHRNLPEAAA